MSFYYPAGTAMPSASANPLDKPGLYPAPPTASGLSGGPLPGYPQPGGLGNAPGAPTGRIPHPQVGLQSAFATSPAYPTTHAAYAQPLMSASPYGAYPTPTAMYQPASNNPYASHSAFQPSSAAYSNSPYAGFAGAHIISTSAAGYPGSAVYAYSPAGSIPGTVYTSARPMQAPLCSYPGMTPGSSPGAQPAFHPGAPPYARGPLM